MPSRPHTRDADGAGSDLETKIERIKREIKDEYGAHHPKPWLIGFSGGKDSTQDGHSSGSVARSLIDELLLRHTSPRYRS